MDPKGPEGQEQMEVETLLEPEKAPSPPPPPPVPPGELRSSANILTAILDDSFSTSCANVVLFDIILLT